ncbi:MAG: ABC-F family ATP-binding cassette domain-containing protein [Bacteroidota bacterium]|nr:MAG: ABC-F family ATP-binding cassette domain-containing protein [Bacteroidota bacterium]
MSAILEVEGLSKSIGVLELFRSISFTIEEGYKTGLIAANGTGKTTILNILAGFESHDEGKFRFLPNKKIGYLSQDPYLDNKKSILEAIFESENESLQLIKKYELALDENKTNEIERLSVIIDNKKLWDYESRIRQMLSQLGIHNLKQKISELSGGQRKRVALAGMLIDEPDFIMLDEPTNHLDVEAINWLESYLQRSRSTLFMVTHDRYFLDRVCNEIIELDGKQIYTYPGNYSYFLEKRTERIEMQLSEISKAENLLRKEEDWMRRMPKARSTKAKYRIDNYYNLKDKASQKVTDKKVRIQVEGKRLGSKILVASGLNFFWGTRCFLKDFSYTYSPYEKIGVLGTNGTGKSTFLDLMTQKLQPESGVIEVGETIKFGYYRQEGLAFDENMKVLESITQFAETVVMADGSVITASQFLTNFLFPPSRQHDFISKLSGGEKRRLYLCSVLMQNPNFLVLDEPTNDLDIATLEVLEEYLLNYAGCVLIVSHDRYFLDELVDHVFVFRGDGEVKDFPGNYSQYLDSVKFMPGIKSESSVSSKTTIPKEKPALKKLSYKEKMEYEQLEKSIETLTLKKQEIETMMSSGNLSPERLLEYSHEVGNIISELDDKELRWLELSEKQGD